MKEDNSQQLILHFSKNYKSTISPLLYHYDKNI